MAVQFIILKSSQNCFKFVPCEHRIVYLWVEEFLFPGFSLWKVQIVVGLCLIYQQPPINFVRK